MKRRGMILVAVLVVTALVTMVAASLLFRMRAETAASAAKGRGDQAYEAALSGLEFATAVLQDYAGDMDVWYDNPDIFVNQLVADDGANAWYFTVYGDDPLAQDNPRYGASDESGKINLNAATADQLVGLAGLTEELVDCLLDYIDADSEARREGAEQEYYDNLPHPYVIPNGPLATLEELLLVKGFDGTIVYGEDANLNGRLDPNEDDGDETFPPDNGDGRLDQGLRGVATVYSSGTDLDSKGNARIDLNAGPPPEDLGLPDDTRRFIDIYLAEGNKFKHPSELLEMRYEVKQEHKDYADVPVGTEIASGVGAEELPLVMDRLTTVSTGGEEKGGVAGLVNVNTAPVEALARLPGLDPNLAQQVVDVRRNLDAQTKATVAWLYAQNLVDADAFKKVAPLVTARSSQFSLRCVGFGVPCGRFRVIEAVLDLAGKTPRVLYLRDITRLGLPFALNADFVERRR